MRAVLLVLAAAAAATTPLRAAEYTIDPEHTFPSLEMPHLGISVWRGKFNRTTGRVTLDRAARTGRVTVEVDVASLDFGLDSMHEYAMKPEWLDVAEHPKMTYAGAIRFDGDVPSALDGELTLKGITKPLALKINRFACVPHPLDGRELCGADVTGVLERADFGMPQYTDDGMGRITLEIQVEALKEPDSSAPARAAPAPVGSE